MFLIVSFSFNFNQKINTLVDQRSYQYVCIKIKIQIQNFIFKSLKQQDQTTSLSPVIK